MSTNVSLSGSTRMDQDRTTGEDGHWYLRQVLTDDYFVSLVSERAPAGTMAKELKPDHLEIEAQDEGALRFDIDELRAFLVWP